MGTTDRNDRAGLKLSKALACGSALGNLVLEDRDGIWVKAVGERSGGTANVTQK